jgi:hypothetical protein
MKRWQNIVPLALAGLSLVSLAFSPQAAHSQDAEAGRKLLYLFSTDFPPNPVVQYPSPPVKETKFWQLLDKEMSSTQDLTLTDNLEDANYRIELRCAGVFNCSKLMVDVKSPKRDVLTSFSIKNISSYYGLGSPKLDQVAQKLTQKLDERIKLLDEGGYGHTD